MSRVVEVPKDQHDWIVRRIQELLTAQGLALAEWDVRRLMAFAYSQGCEDTLQALDAQGIDLTPLDAKREG